MRYYVYSLADPRTGQPFYIGKGSGSRMYDHVRVARRGLNDSNYRKCHRIREIIDAGLIVVERKLAEFDDEVLAYKHEAHLIASTPGLLNISSGVHDPRPRVVREKPAKPWITLKELRRFRAYLAVWATWPNGVTFPNLPNGDALGDEFVENVRKLVARAEAQFSMAA